MRRVLQPEEMDDPQLPEEPHRAALYGLARLNRATAIAPVIYRRIRRLALAAKRPVKVLDIATGSGDLPIYWAKRAAREGLAIQCTGIDFSAVAIAVGREEAAKANVSVDFIQRDVLRDRLPTGYDILTCGLFMHHLEIAQIRQLLLSMQSAQQMAMIICDLERSMLNLACVWFAAHSLSRCPIVHRDAVRSVRAALTREEFQRIVEQTLGRTPRISGLPPCRFLATMEEACEVAPEVAALAAIQSA